MGTRGARKQYWRWREGDPNAKCPRDPIASNTITRGTWTTQHHRESTGNHKNNDTASVAKKQSCCKDVANSHASIPTSYRVATRDGRANTITLPSPDNDTIDRGQHLIQSSHDLWDHVEARPKHTGDSTPTIPE